MSAPTTPAPARESAPAAAEAPAADASVAATPALGRRQIHAVAGCYFVASFAALGLPPYLTETLPEFGDSATRWAGLLYVVPTVFGGLGAPLWGRLADRYGRKRLLLRAQLGAGNDWFGLGAPVLTGTAAAVTAGCLVALPALIRRSFHPRRSR